jgi:hypothetical protein
MTKKQAKGFAPKVRVAEKDITLLVKQLHDLTTRSVLPLVEELRQAHYRQVVKVASALYSNKLENLNEMQKKAFWAVDSLMDSALEDLEHFVDDPSEADSTFKHYSEMLVDVCCALRAGIGYWRDKTEW